MLPKSIIKKISTIKYLSQIRMMSNQISNEVLFDRINQVALITLNRPKQLNSLNISMVKQMHAYLEEVQNDQSIKAVVVKGAGENAFCAGGDVKTIRELCIKGDQDKAMEFFTEEYKLDFKIANLKKPYLALINGVTMGGGVGLSVHGRYRIATEKTMFAMPETAIGFIPDVGGSYFLPRLKANIGLYLALTGNRLRAQDVKRTGIATHFVQSSNLTHLEQKIFQTNDLSYQNIDKILEEFCENVQGEYDSAKISQIFQLDKTIEDIINELELDGSEWSIQQLKLLTKMSPTSLKITIKQMQLGKQMDLKQAFELEHQLCQRFTSFNSDFLEGVRCVLVDKGDKPKWNPFSIKEIDQKTINWYFDPLPSDKSLNLSSSSKI